MSAQIRSTIGRISATLTLATLAAVAGCTTEAQLRLHQPFAPPSQREMPLKSTWAFQDVVDGRRNWLIAFPLPGAEYGPRDFLVYLTTPAAAGDFTASQDAPDAVRGFLIQQVGQLKGKTVFSGGEVRVQPAWFDPQRQQIDLHLACTDGTTVIGRAVAQSSQAEITTFQRHYAADIALLQPSPQPQDLAGDGTSPRSPPNP